MNNSQLPALSVLLNTPDSDHVQLGDVIESYTTSSTDQDANKIVMEGCLFMQCDNNDNKTWKKRWLVLSNSQISIYVSSSKLQLVQSIHLSQVSNVAYTTLNVLSSSKSGTSSSSDNSDEDSISEDLQTNSLGRRSSSSSFFGRRLSISSPISPASFTFPSPSSPSSPSPSSPSSHSYGSWPRRSSFQAAFKSFPSTSKKAGGYGFTLFTLNKSQMIKLRAQEGIEMEKWVYFIRRALKGCAFSTTVEKHEEEVDDAEEEERGRSGYDHHRRKSSVVFVEPSFHSSNSNNTNNRTAVAVY
ncbi:hypothetical protein HDV05_004734 [Chytridiales sp. JEL 0842]|nr:hypothetical protein HDV05_004734 [Chytridiales sp. JEL 0842]